MTFLATAARYDRDGLLARVRGLRWDKGWRPSGITLHNTGGPNLKQAQASPEAAREAAFSSYYRSLHWHSGPHGNVWWDGFYELCDFEHDGVHCSCNNHTNLGIEMLGDFDPHVDAFDEGLGGQVRDNAVFLLAAFCNQLRVPSDCITPHRDCKADGHLCPGLNVDMGDIRARVAAEMTRQGGVATPLVSLPKPPPPASPLPPVAHDLTWVQAVLNLVGAKPPLMTDGKPGPLTLAAVETFQRAHGLTVDGLAGPKTMAALTLAAAPKPLPPMAQQSPPAAQPLTPPSAPSRP